MRLLTVKTMQSAYRSGNIWRQDPSTTGEDGATLGPAACRACLLLHPPAASRPDRSTQGRCLYSLPVARPIAAWSDPTHRDCLGTRCVSGTPAIACERFQLAATRLAATARFDTRAGDIGTGAGSIDETPVRGISEPVQGQSVRAQCGRPPPGAGRSPVRPGKSPRPLL